MLVYKTRLDILDSEIRVQTANIIGNPNANAAVADITINANKSGRIIFKGHYDLIMVRRFLLFNGFWRQYFSLCVTPFSGVAR